MTYRKMNPKVKRSWVKWLRSGRYQQAHYKLIDRTGTEFCCLGVLQNLAVEKGLYDDGPDPKWGSPRPDKVAMDWSGLDESALDHLMKMNDSDGLPFTRIADWIDDNL